jgi:hypothetical protein
MSFLKNSSLLLFLTFLTACGKPKATEAENNKEAANKPQTSTTTQSSPGDATKCTSSNSLSFDNPSVKGAGFSIQTAEARFYMMEAEGKPYPSVRVFFANYAKEGSYVQDPAKPEQRRIMVTFNGLANAKDLNAGNYPAAAQGFGASLGAGAGIQSGEAMGYLTGAKGQAVLDYIGPDKICGTVDIQGSDGTFIKGSFSVPLTR